MLNKLFELAKKENASDLHIKVDGYPGIRINGKLSLLKDFEIMTSEIMEKILNEILNEEEKKEFFKNKNYDIAYTSKIKDRYRINLFIQQGKPALAMRRIANKILTIKELGLPDEIKEIAKEKRGLILVTGAAGNGKSTTISAMIEYINNNNSKNIITLEDPIEYIFKEDKSIINQREIPYDMNNYYEALKYVLRQDPDIIFIGELRDKETMDAAMKASETGHLVVSTLHTVNSYQTINRIINFYPSMEQKQIRIQLADNLKSVISQRLLQKKDGVGRVIAVEIMKTTPTIREAIVNIDMIEEIPILIKKGKEIYGMQTFDQSISSLYLDNKISYEIALESATVKKDIELLKSGISSGSASDFYNEMM